jgi:hypothetical protein
MLVGTNISCRLEIQLKKLTPQEIHESTRVARFYLVQHAKTEKLYQITIKYTKWPQIYTEWPQIGIYQMATNVYQMATNIYQTAVKYTNVFHCKTLQNLPKLGFLV